MTATKKERQEIQNGRKSTRKRKRNERRFSKRGKRKRERKHRRKKKRKTIFSFQPRWSIFLRAPLSFPLFFSAALATALAGYLNSNGHLSGLSYYLTKKFDNFDRFDGFFSFFFFFLKHRMTKYNYRLYDIQRRKVTLNRQHLCHKKDSMR